MDGLNIWAWLMRSKYSFPNSKKEKKSDQSMGYVRKSRQFCDGKGNQREIERPTIPHERPFHDSYPGLSPYSQTKIMAVTLQMEAMDRFQKKRGG